jgi:hypothetical protein
LADAIGDILTVTGMADMKGGIDMTVTGGIDMIVTEKKGMMKEDNPFASRKQHNPWIRFQGTVKAGFSIPIS